MNLGEKNWVTRLYGNKEFVLEARQNTSSFILIYMKRSLLVYITPPFTLTMTAP